MLADEVGLGKTIEALVVFQGMMNKHPKLRTLIIVPETLIYQWQTEINFKFRKDAPIWGVDETENPQILIVSYKDMMADFDRIQAVGHWDLCIVDETHKLLEDGTLYRAVLDVGRHTEHLLLLSATPILRYKEEFGKLLTLLNPKRFEYMPSGELSALLDRQKYIRDIVYNLMRDLPDYSQYDLYDGFLEGLNEINSVVCDNKLAELIAGIDHNAQDKGLSQIRLVLAYIAEFFQIERGIIRHRRAEIVSMAGIKRQLKLVSYSMAGSNVGFYEESCYNSALELAERLCLSGQSLKLAFKLLAAVSSSPYALLEVLQSHNEFDQYDTRYLISLGLQWAEATDKEINRIVDIRKGSEKFFSKLAKTVEFINNDDQHRKKKYLIFTGFSSTAKNVKVCFQRFFGKLSTCSFHSDITPEKMQEAATLFQNEPGYRFMICDESGGEGRNLQIADCIIHFDLPWSPALLEQRIGRLDRIGREPSKDVLSVVVYSQDSVEKSLFRLYNEGLGIFTQSLCGMELAFGQIQSTIENALKADIRFGLPDAIPKIAEYVKKISEEVERERYFDMARQLDINLQNKFDKLIEHFTRDNGKTLMKTMLAWLPRVGFHGIRIESMFSDSSRVVTVFTNDLNAGLMKQAVYYPPSLDDIIGRSRYRSGVRGTFSREAAVKHEDLIFFAPLNPLFDSITRNAEECYQGRCTAMSFEGKVNWTGVLLTWNLKYNPVKLYQEKFSQELVALVKGYLPMEQIVFAQTLDSRFDDVSAEEIVDQLDVLYLKNLEHLGKRNGGALERFKQKYPHERWHYLISLAYKKGKKYAEEQAALSTDLDGARKQLERMLTASKARELFYGFSDEAAQLKSESEIEALLYGMRHIYVELDSIAFINIEKERRRCRT
jgi:superfamily II DNA or RNA helicase